MSEQIFTRSLRELEQIADIASGKELGVGEKVFMRRAIERAIGEIKSVRAELQAEEDDRREFLSRCRGVFERLYDEKGNLAMLKDFANEHSYPNGVHRWLNSAQRHISIAENLMRGMWETLEDE